MKKEAGVRCPLCLHPSTELVAELSAVPVHCNLLWESRRSARECPRGDIRLLWCPVCTVLWNAAFDPQRTQYGSRYESALDHSPTFRDYAGRLAGRLGKRLTGPSPRILEIGCGNGRFLEQICDLTKGTGIGVDSSCPREEDTASVRFLRDPEAWRQHGSSADLILFRHVLEHMEEPRAFLGSLREAMAPENGLVYCEVPNAQYLVESLFVWDIIYEHPFYFTPLALERLFEINGFDVVDLAEDFGKQFLGLTAKPSAAEVGKSWEGGAGGLSPQHVARFGDAIGFGIPRWKERLRAWAEDGEKSVLWGTGSKGVMFLNLVDGESVATVSLAVDANPRKQGCYVPGTGHPVRPPEDLRGTDPRRVLIMNPIYRGEIMRALEELGSSAEVTEALADVGAVGTRGADE
jgi:SAM-dependent methyltransferase